MSLNITNNISNNISNNITIEKIETSIVINIITVLSSYVYGFFLLKYEDYYNLKKNKYDKKLKKINIELDRIEIELNNIIKEIEYEFEKI